MNRIMKKKNNKAQGLSLNMVASSVIVLVVIIVIIIIFTGKFSLFSGSISACESKPGAKCVQENNCPSTETTPHYFSQKMDFKCPDSSQVCCYSQCKAISGICKPSCGNPINDQGPADCKGNNICCKESS
ncbi:hypothetical protein HN695_04700 [Candidatus Woesearchaeota archaeon]|jgi:hypothetical protein|nr:hypothetical protein [Candidatus Woesearchaeota archaeon]MBT5271876.1 hypothetical protein [Candidatus Woesearchaeota archaeon]MBT6041660.1 hypothetical protein [Candidatus Woesearchaeota archaeon]MBT6337364.1 hypothetical protein [Candidatus Woesearchaeota archaeon]MBT7927612.1 hypothetical protein [Candidatus Woesearchaeota archaeon]